MQPPKRLPTSPEGSQAPTPAGTHGMEDPTGSATTRLGRAEGTPAVGSGGARALGPDVRVTEAATVHLVRVLVSIAEFTTSPPAGWRRGAAHLEAIAAVTLQGDTAPQRGEPDPSPQQPPPARQPQQMRGAPASPAASRILPGAGLLPGRAARGAGTSLGRGMGLSPVVGS